MRTYIEDDTYVAEFKASELWPEKLFWERFRVAFNIPYPFLANASAADDCMRDLSWIEQRRFKIVIHEYEVSIRKGKNLSYLIPALCFWKEHWDKKGCSFVVDY
jgi:hypothetical protein